MFGLLAKACGQLRYDSRVWRRALPACRSVE
jgi:hypothetical protein